MENVLVILFIQDAWDCHLIYCQLLLQHDANTMRNQEYRQFIRQKWLHMSLSDVQICFCPRHNAHHLVCNQ